MLPGLLELPRQEPVPDDDMVRRLRRPQEFTDSLPNRLESGRGVCQTGSDSDAVYLLARPDGPALVLRAFTPADAMTQAERQHSLDTKTK